MTEKTKPIEKTEKKQPRKNTGRIIGIIVILLILLVLNLPKLLFFLKPEQQEALILFRETYLDRFMPVRDAEGGFDWLRLVALVFMIAACWAVYRVIRWIFSLIKTKNRHAETLKGLAANVIRYGIVIFGIIFGLNILGADVLTVIAGLGILALIIGFGAQSLIEDIFSGLFILFEGRFYVGDIINVDDFRGEVKSIGIVSTQLADTGGNLRVINNSDIRVLTNLSEITSVAVSLISVACSADLDKAEEIIEGVIKMLPEKYPQYFKDLPKYVGVESLNETNVVLKVTANVDEVNIYMARRMMNREFKKALDAAGIKPSDL